MDRAETASGLVFLAYGTWVLEESLKLPYLVDRVPGPGFLPLWVSLGMVLAGLVLTAHGIRSGSRPSGERRWPGPAGWWRIGGALGLLTASVLLLEGLGFIPITVLFVALVSLLLGTRSWKILASVPLVAAIVIYGVFGIWLKVPLPKGLLSLFS